MKKRGFITLDMVAKIILTIALLAILVGGIYLVLTGKARGALTSIKNFLSFGIH